MKAASISTVMSLLCRAPYSLGRQPALGHQPDLLLPPHSTGRGSWQHLGTTLRRGGHGSALAGGRGEQGSRGGERGRRLCRDLRNRKHLLALGVCEKKEANFQQHQPAVPPPSLPPHRGLPFPAQPCCLTLGSLPTCQAPPGAGRERGDQLTQHLHPTARRALARTRAGCWNTRAPGALGRREPPGHADPGSTAELGRQPGRAARQGTSTGREAASHSPEFV